MLHITAVSVLHIVVVFVLQIAVVIVLPIAVGLVLHCVILLLSFALLCHIVLHCIMPLYIILCCAEHCHDNAWCSSPLL